MTHSIPGAKVCLFGESGSGKTDVITTLITAGITPFIIFTEHSVTTLQASLARRGIEDKLKYHVIPPAPLKWDSQIALLKNMLGKPYATVKSMRDPNIHQYDQFIEILQTCNRFVDDRTGEDFGDVASWGTDRALCLDSITGAATMAFNMQVGGMPVRDQSDYQIVQSNVYRFSHDLTQALRCHLVFIGHLGRVVAEDGRSAFFMSLPGKALDPQFPKLFDDIVYCKHEGKKFTWSTSAPGVVTKNRDLPLSEDLEPDFVQLIEGWKANGGNIIPHKDLSAA